MILLLYAQATASGASSRAQVATPDDLLKRAEEKVAAASLAEAEDAYRQALARKPDSRAARLGLARVLMWRLKIGEAETLFRDLSRSAPTDLDAREGIATIAYWRGNLGMAARELRDIVRRDGSRENARAMLGEIERALQPQYRADASVVDDDQPYRRSAGRIVASFPFEERIHVDAAATIGELDASESRGTVAAVSLGGSVYLQSIESRLAVTLEPMRFPNGDTTVLGAISIARRLVASQSTLAVAFRRDDLLATAAAIERQATVLAGELSWKMERSDGWLAGAHAEALRYFDDNEGHGTDAYVLAPAYRKRATRIWGGIAVSYRDSARSRFRLSRFAAEPRREGGFRYTYEGVYDPYWTPHDLREVRAVVASEHRYGSWSTKIHLDGGVAHDEAVGFGPASGTSPLPPGIAAATFRRDFHPWRAEASISRMLGNVALEMAFERNVTVFYTSNEYRASVARRF